MESAFILGGSAGASSADGLDWANLSAGNALDAWDFLTDQARFNSVAVGPLANTPGWSFTRASTGYAQTSAGALTAFASGELRRTDKGVLIEGARTNLCLQSQDFSTTWTASRTTLSTNAATAPDGTLTAEKLIETTDSGTHRAYQIFVKAASALTYTFSLYLKAAERTFAHIRMAETGESNPATVAVNLSTGAIGTPYGSGTTIVSSSVEALTDGWYRLTLTITTTTDTSLAVYVMSATGLTSSDIGYVGDATKGVYIWGAQLEAASFPSSYIPTTTASATRAADVLTVPVSGIDYPLSLFAEFERAVNTGGIEGVYGIDDGDGTDAATLRINAADIAASLTSSGNVSQSAVTVAGALALATPYKMALRVSTNSVQLARGGTLGTEDTSCTNPGTPTSVRFGIGAGLNSFYGYLRRAAIYSRALTDAELQAVTT